MLRLNLTCVSFAGCAMETNKDSCLAILFDQSCNLWNMYVDTTYKRFSKINFKTDTYGRSVRIPTCLVITKK